MDNEASNHIKVALLKKDISYQLVPPHCHRANLSERTIHTFKNHLKAGLATTYPDYPTTEWDRLIPQVEVILTLLRATRADPQLLDYAYIFENSILTLPQCHHLVQKNLISSRSNDQHRHFTESKDGQHVQHFITTDALYVTFQEPKWNDK